jgi:hypothetical protein
MEPAIFLRKSSTPAISAVVEAGIRQCQTNIKAPQRERKSKEAPPETTMPRDRSTILPAVRGPTLAIAGGIGWEGLCTQTSGPLRRRVASQATTQG